ncbi:MAG: LysM peptidoglycan-binding domain-containing protein, partial [Gemmatimonadales bacterium]
RARGEKIVHRVRRGETLYRIARRYRTTVDSIRRWNGLGSSSLLRPGRRLIVYYRMRYGQEPPAVNEAPVESGTGSLGEGGGLQHRVRRGETLSAIARRYGTSIERLCEWNNLARAAVLIPGTLLSIQID